MQLLQIYWDAFLLFVVKKSGNTCERVDVLCPATSCLGSHTNRPRTAHKPREPTKRFQKLQGKSRKFRDIKVEDKDTGGITGQNHQIGKQCILDYIYNLLSVEINKFDKVNMSEVL